MHLVVGAMPMDGVKEASSRSRKMQRAKLIERRVKEASARSRKMQRAKPVSMGLALCILRDRAEASFTSSIGIARFNDSLNAVLAHTSKGGRPTKFEAPFGL